MSTYVSQGSYGPVTGVADQTGLNPGNWTVTFDPSVLPQVPYFEVSHIVVNGAPGSSFLVYVGTRLWDSVLNGFSNAWDPAVPIPLIPGEYLYFCWSDPVTDLDPPTVTIWLRYDQDVRANMANAFNQTQS